MRGDDVLAYWIEADNGELRIESLGKHHLRGGTYESEIWTKYARKPLDNEVIIVHLSRAGNDWERAAVERLRAKAQAIRTDQNAG